jgi:hypothetical protein
MISGVPSLNSIVYVVPTGFVGGYVMKIVSQEGIHFKIVEPFV